MIITTKSGNVTINKRSAYGKWLIGYTSTDAWSGRATVRSTWNKWHDKKPSCCSWYAWGFICGNIINPLYQDAVEKHSFLKEINEDWQQIKPKIIEAGVKIPEHGFYLNCIPDLINLNYEY